MTDLASFATSFKSKKNKGWLGSTTNKEQDKRTGRDRECVRERKRERDTHQAGTNRLREGRDRRNQRGSAVQRNAGDAFCFGFDPLRK